VLGSAFGNCHGRRQLARMRHREVDRPSADSFGPRLQPARKRHTRLRPADDLHLPPREGARDAEAKGLPDRLFTGEPCGVVLGWVRPRVAVGAFGLREAALAECRVALERPPHSRDFDEIDTDGHWPILRTSWVKTVAPAEPPRPPGRHRKRRLSQIDTDGHWPILRTSRVKTVAPAEPPRPPGRHRKRRLSQVDSYSHSADSRNAGTSAIESTTACGCALQAPASSRNLPVRTRIVCIPSAAAPPMSASTSSPTIHACSGSASSASSAASKYEALGFPSTVACLPVAY